MPYDKRGWEVPDPTPVEVPLKFRQGDTLQEQIKRAIRVELSRNAQEQGYESFEEADDFEVDEEEPLPFSQYEVVEMPYDSPRGIPPEKIGDKDGGPKQVDSRGGDGGEGVPSVRSNVVPAGSGEGSIGERAERAA